jgi:hypothetical protein
MASEPTDEMVEAAINAWMHATSSATLEQSFHAALTAALAVQSRTHVVDDPALRAAEARGYAQAREQAAAECDRLADFWFNAAEVGGSYLLGTAHLYKKTAAAIRAMQPEDQPWTLTPSHATVRT